MCNRRVFRACVRSETGVQTRERESEPERVCVCVENTSGCAYTFVVASWKQGRNPVARPLFISRSRIRRIDKGASEAHPLRILHLSKHKSSSARYHPQTHSKSGCEKSGWATVAAPRKWKVVCSTHKHSSGSWRRIPPWFTYNGAPRCRHPRQVSRKSCGGQTERPSHIETRVAL